MSQWFDETLYPDWGQRFRLRRELARVRSDFQEIVVFDSVSHGTVLVLDGAIQITEGDEFAYQEMLAHVPILTHGRARRVLIIGAGDGGVLRRVLQHSTVEQAVMVEIDGEVIRLAKQFMPSVAGNAWTDPRATVIVGDGLGYVAAAADRSFDVIVVDSTDPIGVGEALFTEEFYRDCARVLDDGGIIVNQAGVPFMQADELRLGSQRRRSGFGFVTAYVVAVPTYVGGFMTLGLASNDPTVASATAEEIGQRAMASGILGTTRYWTPEVQVAAFALPPYIAECLVSGP